MFYNLNFTFNSKNTKVILFIVLLQIIGCNATKQFENTKAENTIESYESFIKENPKSKHIEVAEKELNNLKTDRDWALIKKSRNLNDFREFNIKYPNSKYISESERLIFEITKNEEWERAKKNNKLEDYEFIVKKYPDEYEAVLAKIEIEKINDENTWNIVVNSNDILKYEEYLINFPNGKYSKEAKNKIFEIKFILPDWNQAININTKNTYIDFKSKYGENKYYYDLAQSKLAILESNRFNKLKETGSIDSLKQYLNEYPNGFYYQDAKTLIYKTELNKVIIPAWNIASSKNTRASYEFFVSKYPDNDYVELANNRLTEFEENLWQSANSNIPKTKEYIAKYPNGKYIIIAHKQLSDLEYEKKISQDWSLALKKNTAEAYKNFIYNHGHDYNYRKLADEKLSSLEYETWSNANTVKKVNEYLNAYPYGKYSKEAEKRLIDLEVEAIFKGDYGKLPPMNKNYYGGYSSNNKIEVYNNTAYTLTVLYSGPESKKIVLSPKQKTSVTLINGNYKIAASVNSSSVSNYAGKENLSGGDYDVEYYIVTTSKYQY
jgi:outer membrane protein assembly factor BamD (BamD/ComL family)